MSSAARASAVSQLEPFLHGSLVVDVRKGGAMITMVIGLAAGVFYWLDCYQLAFWILIYAIVYGALGVLRGDEQSHLVYRRGSGLTAVALVPVAWHIGTLAGYL
jgi:hypothetical protein